MTVSVDELLGKLDVSPEPGPEGSVEWPRAARHVNHGRVPPRFLELIARDADFAALFHGKGAKTGDRSPSGKDMVLGHQCRREGFSAEEVRTILQAAPYRVDGGRTPGYLDRTVKAIFEKTPRHVWANSRRSGGGFGMLFAWLLPDIWAGLSPKAKAVYGVMVIHCLRPSGIVRLGHTTLANLAGVSLDSVGLAVKELVVKGLIRRKWRKGGVNYWVNPSPCFEVNRGDVGTEAA